MRAPPGIGSVQTFSGRHINVGLDGTIEMSAEDAQYYIRDGWTKLAEWTTDEAPDRHVASSVSPGLDRSASVPTLSGTEGSNPPSSSEESAANLNEGIR